MMPFSDPFDVYYDRLYRPAIEDAGLQPVRADDLFRPSVIVSDLWNMVQEANVLLAELTTKNANVFYELGLAHAIGKPVILVSETMNDVPFDLQQLRVLMYNKDDPAWGDKLGADITAALRETLAEPVEAVPNIFRKIVESQAPEQDALNSRLDSLETQVRHLRTQRSQERRFRPSLDPVSDLRDVSDPQAFERWVQIWHHRGMSVRKLQSIVVESTIVPQGEAKRIPEILEKGETIFKPA